MCNLIKTILMLLPLLNPVAGAADVTTTDELARSVAFFSTVVKAEPDMVNGRKLLIAGGVLTVGSAVSGIFATFANARSHGLMPLKSSLFAALGGMAVGPAIALVGAFTVDSENLRRLGRRPPAEWEQLARVFALPADEQLALARANLALAEFFIEAARSIQSQAPAMDLISPPALPSRPPVNYKQ